MNDLDMFFWGATKRYVMEKKATFVNFLFHNVHSQHKKVSLSSVLLWFFFSKAFERCFWFWKPIFEQTGGDILEGRISTQFCTVFLERMRWEDKHTVGKNVLKKVSFFVLKIGKNWILNFWINSSQNIKNYSSICAFFFLFQDISQTTEVENHWKMSQFIWESFFFHSAVSGF